jgi:putative ABC transport system substrate-binding protein
LAAWPLTVRAQQPAMLVVGWLDNTAASTTNRLAAFRRGLSAAGFVEGRNMSIAYRFAEDQIDRLPALAADLVRKRVAAIVTNGTATDVAKAATSTIPIVFVTGGDPVEAGLVTSLNRPGGNVTGVSFTSAPLNPRRLEVLHELVPKPAVIAALIDANLGEAPIRELDAAAGKLGRQIVIVKAGNEREIDAAFAKFVQAGAGALFVGTGAFFNSRRQQIVALAARHALPAIRFASKASAPSPFLHRSLPDLARRSNWSRTPKPDIDLSRPVL